MQDHDKSFKEENVVENQEPEEIILDEIKYIRHLVKNYGIFSDIVPKRLNHLLEFVKLFDMKKLLTLKCRIEFNRLIEELKYMDEFEREKIREEENRKENACLAAVGIGAAVLGFSWMMGWIGSKKSPEEIICHHTGGTTHQININHQQRLDWWMH